MSGNVRAFCIASLQHHSSVTKPDATHLFAEEFPSWSKLHQAYRRGTVKGINYWPVIFFPNMCCHYQCIFIGTCSCVSVDSNIVVNLNSKSQKSLRQPVIYVLDCTVHLENRCTITHSARHGEKIKKIKKIKKQNVKTFFLNLQRISDIYCEIVQRFVLSSGTLWEQVMFMAGQLN